MKCWDIGGQAQYRSEWGRYTRGCDVIVYVVDAHAEEKVWLEEFSCCLNRARGTLPSSAIRILRAYDVLSLLASLP